jgi:hypothetical protein
LTFASFRASFVLQQMLDFMNRRIEKGLFLNNRMLERLLVSVIKEAEWRGAFFMKPVIEAAKAIENNAPDKTQRLDEAWCVLRDAPSQKTELKP